MIMANETKIISPTLFSNISKAFGDDVPVETIEHPALKEMSKTVKAIIRTGDFTAYGNVILVSGAGGRWKVERAG
jgi:D-ribose pyranase